MSSDRWSGEDERGGTEWSSCFLFLAVFSAIGEKMASGIGEEKYPGSGDSDGGALAGGHASKGQPVRPPATEQ